MNGDSYGDQGGGDRRMARSLGVAVAGAAAAALLAVGGWSPASGSLDDRDVVNGGHDGERMVGTQRPDAIYGHGGDDRLVGRRSGDFLSGGRGDDRIKPGRGADLIRCGPGDDVVVGAGKTDRVDPNCELVRAPGQSLRL